MRALNIREEDTQGQTKPISDLFRDNLKDVINSNINDQVLSRNNLL